MPNGLPEFTDEQRQLIEFNARNAGRLEAFASRLRTDRRTIEDCRRYSAAVRNPLVGGGLDTAPRDSRGARAILEVLTSHPAFGDERVLPFGAPVIGAQSADPAEFDARRDVAEFLAVGLSALAAGGRIDEQHVLGVVTVAFGADAFSHFVRDIVLGRSRGFDLDLDHLIPPRLIDLDVLNRRGCVRAIQDAALDLAIGLQPARAWETGITALVPATGCPGDRIVIRGSGFGATQPNGVVVRFSKATGGCVEAQVVSWTDTAVTVVVPVSAGPGCVGFGQAGTPFDATAASTFAGELERCIGPAAFPVANKIRSLGGVAPPPPCPSCLTGGANRFEGGRPVLETFLANDGHDVTVEPGGAVVLRWTARGAQTLSLTRTTMLGPFAPPPTPLPASGSLSVGPFTGSSPVTAKYRLSVSNACGTEIREVTVRLQRTPKLSLDAIEVVQVIQRADNSVRLAAFKRTVVRLFVDSGITDGFDYGSGPNVVPNIVGSMIVFPVGGGFGTSATPLPSVANAVPAAIRSRANAAHSLTFELPQSVLNGQVRIDAQVAVPGHEADVGGPWKAFASTTVTFVSRPAQTVLPLLVSDPTFALPAPSLAAYTASLQEAVKRFPFAEPPLGWIVNPEVPIPARNAFGGARNLSSDVEWGLFLTDIMWMTFAFARTPVGGLRTALVPRNRGNLTDSAGNPIPAYAMNGIASPRVGGLAPTMICQAGLTGTFAHEMGHSGGLGHAPCPAPPGMPGSGGCADPPDGIDARLPGGTDEVGFDAQAGNVIPTGRGELMSYCGDSSRCPGTTRWPSIVTWDIFFNGPPIS